MLFREIKEYLSKWWDIINTMFNSLSVILPMNQCYHCQQQSNNTAILHNQGNVSSPQTDLQLQDVSNQNLRKCVCGI